MDEGESVGIGQEKLSSPLTHKLPLHRQKTTKTPFLSLEEEKATGHSQVSLCACAAAVQRSPVSPTADRGTRRLVQVD